MIAGGRFEGRRLSEQTATVLKYNSSKLNSTPVEMESMIYSRDWHACSIFKSELHEGRPIMIVAGPIMFPGKVKGPSEYSRKASQSKVSSILNTYEYNNYRKNRI